MKKLVLNTLLLLLFSSFSAIANETTDSVKVWGNCGMCQARIEKAAKEGGAARASWSEDSKILNVSFNPAFTSLKAIEQKVAAIGHDTENNTAPMSVYGKLPGCCKYDRKPGAAQ
jgi:hypothetical protein